MKLPCAKASKISGERPRDLRAFIPGRACIPLVAGLDRQLLRPLRLDIPKDRVQIKYVKR